jgi:hypothetical protein
MSKTAVIILIYHCHKSIKFIATHSLDWLNHSLNSLIISADIIMHYSFITVHNINTDFKKCHSHITNYQSHITNSHNYKENHSKTEVYRYILPNQVMPKVSGS